MKINAKVKVVTIGVAAVLMLSVAGIFLFLDETKSGHEDLNAANPNNPISSENTDQNKEGLYASQKDIAEAIAFLDKLDKNNEYGKNSKADESLSGITVDTIKTDKSTVKDEKTNISERTPEQQHKYDLLAQFLPKYHELHNWFIEIDKEEKVQPPKELLGDEVKIWMQQRSKELESKYPRELRKERYAEQIRIHGLLLREFPEAIEGETFNAPGWGTFTLIRFTNYRKLREIVGGPLPTDKGKYVKVGNDWVPAD